jgi:hypothetical protein
MKNDTSVSKPYKILLHMARVGNEWKGKATCYETQSEYNFSSISELKEWLSSQCAPAKKVKSG